MVRVLLADDDAALRDFARRALEADGHTVTVASDGLEGVDALERAKGAFDVLVTDVDMPQLDGVALAGRAIELAPAISVLLMSGYSEQLDRGRHLNAVRVGTITKPFTLDAFRSAVRKLGS